MPSVGQCIGPYRLLRTLGAGGMGVVFEARHEETGQTVALKSVGIPEASAMLGLRREIQALSRLSHPDIVRVLDHGIVDGAPWFAMELLAGTSLRRHLELAFGSVGGSLASTQARSDDSIERTLAGSTWVLGRGTEPPASTTPDVRRAAGPLREALVVASRLCDPLAYLHGEGIVHRDLKPENVFLRPDGTPVLVDFGLQSGWATGVSRDSVSMAGQLGGSLRYMAPEQARGELVDARADLYALGCILYELLTGAPPFTAMSAPEMVWLHANAAPPPPSTHAAGISQALDELVLALLTKDPAARIGHASLVKRSLAGIAGIDLDEPAGALRPFLFRPAFVGRESDLAMIAERVDRARSGEGSMLCISGNSGSGKTRLLMEAAAQAAREGVPTVLAECAPPVPGERGDETPLGALRPLLQALGDALRERGPDETLRAGSFVRVLGAYEERLLKLPGLSRDTEVAELPAVDAERRLHRALAEGLRFLTSRKTLLLLIDDLQWADRLSLSCLAAIAPAVARMPALVLGTFRAEESGAPLGPAAAVHVLEGLDRGAVEGMVAGMLGASATPTALARDIASHSEGSPFFVAEYLRAAAAAGLLVLDARGRFALGEADAPIPLPGTIRELIARRLEPLGEDALHAIEVASVLGRSGDLATWSDVAGFAMDRLLGAMQELMTRSLLDAEGERYRFVHDKIREVVYEAVSASRRAAIHRLAAQAIDLSADAATRQAALGLHWERSGDLSRARTAYLEGARWSSSHYDFDGAEVGYRACIGADGPMDALGVEAALELTRRVLTIRDRREAELLERALGIARALGARVLEARCLMEIAQQKPRGSLESEPFLRAAQAAYESAGVEAGVAVAQGGLAHLLQDHGRLAEAEALYRTALERIERLGIEDYSVRGNFATLLQEEGRNEEARAMLGGVLEGARRTRSIAGEGTVVLNLGNLELEAGNLDDAGRHYDEALAIARRTEYRNFESYVLGNRGNLHRARGETERAVADYEAAIAISREVGDARHEGQNLTNLGDAFMELDRIDDAERVLDAAIAIHRTFGNSRFEGAALEKLARIARDRGDLARARELFSRARVLLEGLWGNMSGVLIDVELARIARLDGDTALAARMASGAREIAASSGHPSEECRAWIELGHVEIAGGRSGAEHLARARAGAPPAASHHFDLPGGLERLDAAESARTRGARLIQGEDPELLPGPLKVALTLGGEGA